MVKCHKVLTLRDAKKLFFEDAARVTIDRTKKTGNEVAFRYDRTTRKPISHIVEGTCSSVTGPPTNRPKDRPQIDRTVGDFHTHPRLEEGKCAPSIHDINAVFFEHKAGEIAVGCPNDEFVIFPYPDPAPLTDLVLDVARFYHLDDLGRTVETYTNVLASTMEGDTEYYLRKHQIPFEKELATKLAKARADAHNTMYRRWRRELWDEPHSEHGKLRKRIGELPLQRGTM